MEQQPALLIRVGGTQVAVALRNHFAPGLGLALRCLRCASLTTMAARHLEWHISIGDNPLAPPTGEQSND
jgi:hypothetical protein